MDPILTRCGYRCDLCLAYKPNVELDPSNLQKLSDGWLKFYGFRIQPEKNLCDGCMVEGGKLIDKGCPVRPCVLAKGLENCSACDLYVCEKLKERIVIFEEIKAKIGSDIPQDDYACFIQPYENFRRLEALRQSGEIVD